MVILLIQLPLPSTYGISVYILCLLCLFKCVCGGIHVIHLIPFRVFYFPFLSFYLSVCSCLGHSIRAAFSLSSPSMLQIGFYCISLREGCGRQLTFNTNPNKFVYSFELNVNWYNLHMFQSRPLAATSHTLHIGSIHLALFHMVRTINSIQWHWSREHHRGELKERYILRKKISFFLY